MTLLTEEEAKTKWCPYATIFSEDSRHLETAQLPGGFVSARCIASECMAWRWEEEEYLNAMEHYEAVTPIEGVACIPPSPRGWCGLAGKPEMPE